ncbi:MAG: MFS transporter [Nostoc sp. ChiSLP01]|nr:MFS transporter [Nostoc sp. CmiSLP01]MDZ8287250.1 MFS transporter [Nostoc sp. ChiSLP01]
MQTLQSFESRNFRLFFSGQMISMIGSFMAETTTAWLVYSLTNSVALLGLLGFICQFPHLIVSPLAGVLIERSNRRTILITAQFTMMIVSLILAVLTLRGLISIWHIIGASILQGLIASIETPTRYAFIVDIIKKEDITNATALHSSLLSGSRIVAPASAGIIIANFSPGHCFLIDSISYIAVIFALLAIRFDKPLILQKNHQHNIWQDLKEGFTYAYELLPIRYILLLIALFSFMGMPYLRIMPVFAVEILHGDSSTLGWLTGASGFGALCGGIYLSYRTSAIGLEKIIAIAPVIFGIALITFSLSNNFWFSLTTITIVGCGYILEYSSSNAILQTISEDEKRGRIMSLYNMFVMGIIPFGNLFIGGLASIVSAKIALSFGAICCIIGSIKFYTKLPLIEKTVRQTYIKNSIVME